MKEMNYSMRNGFKRLSMITALILALSTPIFSASIAFAADSEHVTRGEFIQQIIEQLKAVPSDTSVKLPVDVTESSVYADAVKVMLERQVMEGYSDGTFRLDQAITKDESSYIVGRLLGVQDEVSLTKLQDHFGASFGDTNTLSHETSEALIQTALSNDTSAVEWIHEASVKQLEASTFRADAGIDMSIYLKPGFGEEAPIHTTMNMIMEFNKDQGLHQVTTTDVPMPTGTSQMEMEQYTVTEGTYMKMPDPTTGAAKWFNMSKQIPFTFDQFMELQLKSQELSEKYVNPYFFYRDLGAKEVDGLKLHQIEMNGKLTNMEDLLQIIGTLDSNLQQAIASSNALSGMSLSMSTILSFNQETKLLTSLEANYVIQYGNEMENPVDRMEMTMNMSYKDYNEAIEIVLPEEASNAEEFVVPQVPAM
jgi:hypothetical protein